MDVLGMSEYGNRRVVQVICKEVASQLLQLLLNAALHQGSPEILLGVKGRIKS